MTTEHLVNYEGRALPTKLRHIAEREATARSRLITIRSMRCGRGCPHGRAWYTQRHIRLYLSTDEAGSFDTKGNLYLIIHELAHLSDWSGGHTESFYIEAIRIATRAGVLRPFLNWQGNKAKAANRRLKARRRAIAA